MGRTELFHDTVNVKWLSKKSGKEATPEFFVVAPQKDIPKTFCVVYLRNRSCEVRAVLKAHWKLVSFEGSGLECLAKPDIMVIKANAAIRSDMAILTVVSN